MRFPPENSPPVRKACRPGRRPESSGRTARPSPAAAVLKVPDGRGGPAFLVANNFNVIKRYNNADKYALAVGLLADAIAGGGLVNDWNRPFTKLSFDQRIELQQRLARAGHYEGKFDGKIGDGSKKAILQFQSAAGLTRDGYPSMEVLKVLRERY